MKRKGTLLIGIICFVVMASFVVHAQDATPEPGTPQENECNPGGVLYRAENQDGCPNEWYWKAGWYLAAVNNGRISRDDVPDEFASALPPAEENDPDAPWSLQEPAVGTCWYLLNIFAYGYIGPYNTLGNLNGFASADNCPNGNHSHMLKTALIFAPNESDVLEICATLGTVDYVEPFSYQVSKAPKDSYLCHVK